MPRKETIDKLRTMIRDLEAKHPSPEVDIGVEQPEQAVSEGEHALPRAEISTGAPSPARPGPADGYRPDAGQLGSSDTSVGQVIPSLWSPPSLCGGARLPGIPHLSTGAGAATSARHVISEIAPSELTVEETQHFRIIHSKFPGGTPTELSLPPEDALPALRSLEPRLSSLSNWLYLDIETTGLLGAATVPFLVGFGEWSGSDFHVTQLFLTDRAEEEFLMEEVARRIEGRHTLATFNGKAFDVPLLWGRFAMCGMRPPRAPDVHLDILSAVRNMGRRPQYGQSLKEAMRRFTGIVRNGDIPGNLIPALYFIYERDGDASILEPVLKHNRLDVLDMACLVWVLCHVLSGDPSLGDSRALGGAGKLHLRRGNLDLARRCLETAIACDPGRGGDPVAQNRLLGHVLRKQGDWRGAADAFAFVVSSGEAKDEDYLWLARSLELGAGDVKGSLDVVATAVARYAALGKDPPLALRKRLRRLERRIERCDERVTG